jgi:hypothetical protein
MPHDLGILRVRGVYSWLRMTPQMYSALIGRPIELTVNVISSFCLRFDAFARLERDCRFGD